MITLAVQLGPYGVGSTGLYIAGYAWMLLIPLPNLGEDIRIDENALQPGQVCKLLITLSDRADRSGSKVTTYWDWNDVHVADTYLAQIEALYARNATSQEWVLAYVYSTVN